jgi:hypothetical protein
MTATLQTTVNLKMETSFYWVSFPLQLVRFWRHDHVMYSVCVSLWLVRKREGKPWEDLARQCISSGQIHCTHLRTSPMYGTPAAWKCRYVLFHLIRITYRRADNCRPVPFTVSAWEWVYATNLSRLQRETRGEGEREEQANGTWEKHKYTNNSDPITSTSELLSETVSLRMLTNLRFADLRLTTAQQRATGQKNIYIYKKTKQNSMVWVRERTIPTERPPLVGEVIANFCG